MSGVLELFNNINTQSPQLDPTALIRSLLPSASQIISRLIGGFILVLIRKLISRQYYNRYNKTDEKIKLLKHTQSLLEQQIQLQKSILEKLSQTSGVRSSSLSSGEVGQAPAEDASQPTKTPPSSFINF